MTASINYISVPSGATLTVQALEPYARKVDLIELTAFPPNSLPTTSTIKTSSIPFVDRYPAYNVDKFYCVQSSGRLDNTSSYQVGNNEVLLNFPDTAGVDLKSDEKSLNREKKENVIPPTTISFVTFPSSPDDSGSSKA